MNIRMVDVSSKRVTKRRAIAKGKILMKPETIRIIKEKKVPKGDVLMAAKLAGIQGAKRTPDLIPLCHPLSITNLDMRLKITSNGINIEAEANAYERTGVEMEALTAVAISALTIYDMCKQIDKEMRISDIRLIEKAGGRSGRWVRKAR